MKGIVKKSIILFLVITMLISILGTISKLFFGKNLNIATVNEEKIWQFIPQMTNIVVLI